MERLTLIELSEVVDRYVIPAKQLFPLCSESLAMHFSYIVNDHVNEDEIIDAFRQIGYIPYISKDIPWDEDYALIAHFKVRFIRDIHTRGLFNYDDAGLCKSLILKRIIHNAKEHPEKRLRDFCYQMNTSSELSVADISDEDILDYLKWMALHTPSPKSTLAALLLYYIDKEYAQVITPDQLQFIRENPELKII